jgi:Ca2+-binding RTX toxin-like protein
MRSLIRLTGWSWIGEDTISGGNDADRIYGDSGNDLISGDACSDELTGGAGNDWFEVGSGDTVTDFGTDDGGSGDGNLLNNDVINLTKHYDYLEQAQADFKENGRFTLIGADGVDVTGLVASDLTEDNTNLPSYASMIYDDTSGADDGNIVGTTGDDLIISGVTADGTTGAATDATTPDDRILGGDGNDEISGEADNDTLTGGAGSDLFNFFEDDDTITDFNPLEDTLDLFPHYTSLAEAKTDLDTNGMLTLGGAGTITFTNGITGLDLTTPNTNGLA